MAASPPEPAVFTGLDETSAAITALFAGLPLLMAGVAAAQAVGWLPALGGAVLLLVGLGGRRYRLSISAQGIEVANLALGWIPISVERFPLDATIELYQSVESEFPEGLCIQPPIGWGRPASDCFGPHFRQERLMRLLREAEAALARCRAANPPTPGPFRCPIHPQLGEALEPLGRQGWASGRLRSARLRAEVEVGGIRLPEGSLLEFNAEGYLEPRTEDLLRAAMLAAPTELPMAGRPQAVAGCRLGFDPSGRACSAQAPFAEPTRLGVVVVDGASSIAWNAEGALEHFTLGAPLRVGPIELPPGSRFMPWPDLLSKGAPDWVVHPGSPVALPELVVPPKGTLIVAADLSLVRAVMIDADVSVGDLLLKGGILHWPLDGSLRIDLPACRKMGLFR